LTETVSTDCSARTVAFAAFSPFADDPGTAEVGRFSPLPTPRNSVFLTEWNGRFLAESCPSCLEPQTSILSLGKAGIRRAWRDNSFTLYLYLYPRGFSLPDSPFYGFFGPKIGLLEVPLICGFGKILPVVCLAYGTAQPHTPQSALYPPLWKQLRKSV
jgi:hypothetical protein